MSSRFIDVVAGVRISFLFMAEKYAIVCIHTHTHTHTHTTFSLSIQPSMDTCAAFPFQLWQIMLLWMWVCKYLFEFLLSIFRGYIPRSRIAGPCGNSIFNFLRNYQVVFHSSCTILHDHQQNTSVPISPQIHQHLISLFDNSHPNGYEVLSHCGFDLHFPISDVEQIFICLLTSRISSLEKCLFKSFAHFLIRLSACCWVVGILYIFWILTPYQIYDLQIISPFHGLPFTLLLVSFDAQKFLIWM